MKIRTGFVSNSSSSSFTVNMDKLSERDTIILMNYQTVYSQEDSEYSDYWIIEKDITRGLIIGSTNMDNDDLSNYLDKNGVDQSVFSYGE